MYYYFCTECGKTHFLNDPLNILHTPYRDKPQGEMAVAS